MFIFTTMGCYAPRAHRRVLFQLHSVIPCSSFVKYDSKLVVSEFDIGDQIKSPLLFLLCWEISISSATFSAHTHTITILKNARKMFQDKYNSLLPEIGFWNLTELTNYAVVVDSSKCMKPKTLFLIRIQKGVA